AGGWRIDMRHAGFDLVNETEDAGGIVGEDRGRQTELSIVGDLHRFVEILDAHHTQNRPKDLFTRNAHIRSNVIENRRLHKVTLIEAVTRRALAATNKCGAVFPADVEIVEDRLELTLIYARANLGLGIHTVAESHCLRAFCNSFHEFVS